MSEHVRLIDEVNAARRSFIAVVRDLSPEQGRFQPAADVWSALDNTEHIVRAEQGGLYGMWSALDGFLNARPVWTGVAVHDGKSIEQVIAETWQEKEQVPAVAAPVWGGSLHFWIATLEANQQVLAALGRALEGVPLAAVHFPHPISGPLDLRQRLEFLRFHLDRHRQQVERLRQHPDFPAARAAGPALTPSA
jgi:hypothetical protein